MRPKNSFENKEQPIQSVANHCDNKTTRVISLEEAVKLAQSKVREYVPQNVSLADELIRDRQDEAKRE